MSEQAERMINRLMGWALAILIGAAVNGFKGGFVAFYCYLIGLCFADRNPQTK